MNNEVDDFNNAINNVKVERIKPTFKIIQLKLEHFYWNSGDIFAGMPVSTSVELTSDYNFEKDKLEWNVKISHTYLSLENEFEHTTNTYVEKIENLDNLIVEIEKNDLRELKNNYFTEENPERFTHWELTYNNYYKVVGTYDQSIDEFEKISGLLQFQKIMDKETKKIQDKIKNMQ